jgi:hypothetical protein
LVLSIIVEMPQWLQHDGAKLFFFGSVFFALLVAARWASSKSESSYQIPDGDSPEITNDQSLPSALPNATSHGVPLADSELHPRMRLGKYEIRKLYFDTFEAMTGPPSPDSFCDELTIEVEDCDTGYTSTWGFTVGTPSGIDAKMISKQWKIMYLPEILVVRRYDLDQIRNAVMDQITVATDPIPEKASEDAGFTT